MRLEKGVIDIWQCPKHVFGKTTISVYSLKVPLVFSNMTSYFVFKKHCEIVFLHQELLKHKIIAPNTSDILLVILRKPIFIKHLYGFSAEIFSHKSFFH